MKTLDLYLITVAIFALIVTAACKKSKDSNSDFTGLSATINGTAYKGSNVTGTHDTYYNYIEIDSYTGNSRDLFLIIPDTAQVNKPLDISVSGITYFKGGTYYTIYNNGSHGTTTLTLMDTTNKKIAGKFSGVMYAAAPSTAKDSIVVTNGQFNISYK